VVSYGSKGLEQFGIFSLDHSLFFNMKDIENKTLATGKI
jgi:hypothetical protein